MNLKKALTKDTISLDIKSSSKEEVIEEMIDILVSAGKIKDRKSALNVVIEREKKMSTGMQNGIAIPHGKTDTVETLVAALGVKSEGIDFDSIDGKPSTIFIMTISPANRTGPHIQFLAEISRLLNDPATRQKVLTAQSKEEVVDTLQL
ncbi:MAG: PTS sugar transporter subunit IIA [Verrucomicrobia bacterium]|nr:PTS sugar transporter subunit IIA [Verrucomicrobiota bacterium]